jgi:RNA polymerase sigma-70 factor (ECF subfamily)
VKEYPEEEIIAQLKDGNEIALKRIFDIYYRPLTLFALKYVGDIEESKEIVQEFFIRLWSRHDKIAVGFSLKGYLYQAVRNACLNHIESKKVFERKTRDYIPSDISNDNPFEKMVAAEQEERLMYAIDQLPEKCRQIFFMSRMQSLSNQDIAGQLNLSVKTVEAQITIALKRLRDIVIAVMMLLCC